MKTKPILRPRLTIGYVDIREFRQRYIKRQIKKHLKKYKDAKTYSEKIRQKHYIISLRIALIEKINDIIK
jgi:hypothetical protein